MRPSVNAILVAALLAACGARAAELTNSAGAPFKSDVPLVHFSETDFHFGNLAPGETGEHTFYVTNVSTRVVEVTDVRPGGPGALRGGEWDHKIQPGQIGRIPVRLRMPGIPRTMPKFPKDTILRAVTVSFRGPTNFYKTLLIRGKIWTPIAAKPESVEFLWVEGECGEQTNSVRIINQTDQPLSLDAPACTNPAFRPQLRLITLGKEYELLVVCSNSLPAAVGPSVGRNHLLESEVTIKTSNTNLPLVTIPILVTPKSLFILSTPVELMRHEFGRGYSSCGLSIYPEGKLPVRVLGATVNAETTKIFFSDRPDGSWYVQAMFPLNAPEKEDLAFTISTTHPALPKFTVPIKR